ncbi:MAG: hypothetical protein RMJ37_04600 [Spirochaetia bacterium]|nr:hypothetical protein [Spirochaetota bacterium]MCX8096796.1 hypothetical protein [Spirochaetota bacterium]MDW8112607.1 hypothetical protein [Spirochaetia bacterium]
MLMSKILDIVGAIVYVAILFLGIRLGFKESFRVFLFIAFITVFNTVIFRIFKYFIVQDYLLVIDVGVVIVSSLVSFFLFFQVVNRIYEMVGEIDIPIVSKMVGFLLFAVNGVFIIGYFVIFTDIYPQLHYILETSSFLRIMSNIVKFIIGIRIL